MSCADSSSIYNIPQVLYREHLDSFLIRKLNLPFRDVELDRDGATLLDRVHDPEGEITGPVGRQVRDLPDLYYCSRSPRAIRAGTYGERHKEIRVGCRHKRSRESGTPSTFEFGVVRADSVSGASRGNRRGPREGVADVGICIGLRVHRRS